MGDPRIIAVIALGPKGIEHDGWVDREQWERRDERLRALFLPVHAVIGLDGEGYAVFSKRYRQLLAAAETAYNTGGDEAAKAVIDRCRKEVAPRAL